MFGEASLAPRIRYVYLHIDREVMKNGRLGCPHLSVYRGVHPSSACHSPLAHLADGIGDAQGNEVSA